MKKLVLAVALFAGAVCATHAQLTINDFTDYTTSAAGAFNGGASSWTMTQGAGTGDIAFQDGFTGSAVWSGGSLDLSQALTMTLSATQTVFAGSADGYTVAFLDGGGGVLGSLSWITAQLGTAIDATSLQSLGTVQGYSIGGAGSAPGTFISASFDDLSFTQIPEPSSFALMGLGGAALYFLRRRRK
jgi:hypothetical protein